MNFEVGDDFALGPAANGAGDIKGGGSRIGARHNPIFEGREFGLKPGGQLVEACDTLDRKHGEAVLDVARHVFVQRGQFAH